MGTCLISNDKLIAGNKGKRGNDGIVMDGNEQGRVGNDVPCMRKAAWETVGGCKQHMADAKTKEINQNN